MKKMIPFLFLLPALLSPVQALQVTLDNETFQAQTLSPLQASTNKAGDRFTLLVLSPGRWKDAMIEGEITEAKTSGKSGGGSSLNFAFQKMALPNGSIVPVQASLIKATNSRGEVGRDEDGHAIGQSSHSNDGSAGENPGKGKNIFSRFGRKVAKGAKGLAQKIAGGMTIAFTSENKDIRFAPGSIFTLAVSTAQSSKETSKKTSKKIESPD